jgi:hypothetical protein
MLRIPYCPDNLLTDGGKVVNPTHRPHFTPQKHYYFYVSGTHSVRGCFSGQNADFAIVLAGLFIARDVQSLRYLTPSVLTKLQTVHDLALKQSEEKQILRVN